MSALAFPSEQDFETKKSTRAIKWSELPLGIYSIESVTEKSGKFGASFIAELETQAGDKYKVWLPQRLGNDLHGFKLPVFVKHEGLMQSEKGSYKYYAYTLRK